jgi:hypothetical protein
VRGLRRLRRVSTSPPAAASASPASTRAKPTSP